MSVGMDYGRADRAIAAIQRSATELRLMILEESTCREQLEATIRRLSSDLAAQTARLAALEPPRQESIRGDYRSPPEADG